MYSFSSCKALVLNLFQIVVLITGVITVPTRDSEYCENVNYAKPGVKLGVNNAQVIKRGMLSREANVSFDIIHEMKPCVGYVSKLYARACSKNYFNITYDEDTSALQVVRKKDILDDNLVVNLTIHCIPVETKENENEITTEGSVVQKILEEAQRVVEKAQSSVNKAEMKLQKAEKGVNKVQKRLDRASLSIEKAHKTVAAAEGIVKEVGKAVDDISRNYGVNGTSL